MPDPETGVAAPCLRLDAGASTSGDRTFKIVETYVSVLPRTVSGPEGRYEVQDIFYCKAT